MEEKEIREEKKIEQKTIEKRKENIINEESHKIREQFIKDSNTFCLKEIQKYDTSEIQKLVNSFKNSENIINNLEEQIIEKTKEYLSLFLNYLLHFSLLYLFYYNYLNLNILKIF